MKPPREILLSRHNSATPKLDAIRRRVVADYVTDGQPVDRKVRGTPFTLIIGLWHELVSPCRWAWLSLAALWIIIVPIQSSIRFTSATPNPSIDPRNVISLSDPILVEQLRLRAQLMRPEESPSLGMEQENRLSPRTDISDRQRPA